MISLRFVLLIGLMSFMSQLFSQSQLWTKYDERLIDNSDRGVIPDKYAAFELKFSDLSPDLSALSRSQGQSLSIDIPLPDGGFEAFEISKNQVIPDLLGAQFPEIGAFTGVSKVNPGRKIYLDISPSGLHAMIIGTGPDVFIDPYYKNDNKVYVSYFKKDFSRKNTERWSCGFDDKKANVTEDKSGNEDPELKFKRNYKAAVVTKQYQLAVAVTGEYTALFGGTVGGGLAAVVTTINRVTGVYESEVGVQLSLVPNNNLIIYTNSLTDPFNNNSGDLNLVQGAIDGTIGSPNYDVGHVFTSSNGGVATLGVVCADGSKARGLTGLPNPTGDPFYIDYVAHEMGHQFDGLHTFNGDSGSCSGGNRSASAAYEPGSGSTIMAYAGICGNDNLQNNSDAYFHLKSLMEITDLINGSAAVCATDIDNGNNMPTSNANFENIDGMTIPAFTSFELTGDGGDIDGGPLTYQWDQWDLGDRLDATSGDNGESPIFRTFFARTSKTRTFPKLSDLLNNTTTIGEILPTTTRTLNFQFIVRDNVGGWMNDQITLNVTNAAGPFLMTSQNTSGTLSGTINVTWDVAGTTGNGINCSDVDILLSTDGGLTFPTVLASNVTNDGSEMVIMPEIFANYVRIKVKCSNNVFFDINNVNMQLTPTSLPCNTVSNVGDNPIPDGTYSSATELTSDGTVAAASNVRFTGTTSVLLDDNFTVNISALFEASVFPCTN